MRNRFRSLEDWEKYLKAIESKDEYPLQFTIPPYIAERSEGETKYVVNPEYRDAEFEQIIVML